MTSLPIARTAALRIEPDPGRVIIKPFLPGEAVLPDGSTRIAAALGRVLALTDEQVATTYDGVLADFGGRHPDLPATFERHASLVAQRPPVPGPLSATRRRLIGAYFSHEYAIEGAALGNPSIVVGPDQEGLPRGATRFVMSLRAIGEGHVSCIELRTGVVSPDLALSIDPVSRLACTGTRSAASYDKDFFAVRLAELGAHSTGADECAEAVLAGLDDHFSITDIEDAIRTLDASAFHPMVVTEQFHRLHFLASSG